MDDGQYPLCDCKGCENELITFEEVLSGICDGHMQLLKQDKYYAGICWNCSRITLIGNRFRTVRKPGTNKRFEEEFIKDKYIFSKGCVHCTGSEKSNVDWMTINSTSLPTTEVLESKKCFTREGHPRLEFQPIKQNQNITKA